MFEWFPIPTKTQFQTTERFKEKLFQHHVLFNFALFCTTLLTALFVGLGKEVITATVLYIEGGLGGGGQTSLNTNCNLGTTFLNGAILCQNKIISDTELFGAPTVFKRNV